MSKGKTHVIYVAKNLTNGMSKRLSEYIQELTIAVN